MLRNLLTVRALFNLVFGVVFLYWAEHEVLRGLGRGGFYALVDGVLTLTIAAALLRTPARGLAWLAGADGALRVAAGTFIFVNPGVEQMPLTAALFLVVLTIAFIVLGILGLASALIALRRQLNARGDTTWVWSAAAVSLSTLLLGVGFALTSFEQQLRVILSWYAIALGIILGYAALRVAPAAVPASPPAVAG